PQPGDHPVVARGPVLLQKPEPFAEDRTPGVDEVAQHVEAPGGVGDGQLDAGHQLDARAGGGRRRLGEPVDRVVVGDGQGAQAGATGKLYELRRRERAVGGGRVRVEVDGVHRRVGRPWGRWAVRLSGRYALTTPRPSYAISFWSE